MSIENAATDVLVWMHERGGNVEGKEFASFMESRFDGVQVMLLCLYLQCRDLVKVSDDEASAVLTERAKQIIAEAIKDAERKQDAKRN